MERIIYIRSVFLNFGGKSQESNLPGAAGGTTWI